MKYILCIFYILLSVSFAFSQTYYMNVNLKDGNKETYEIGNIQKIDFNDITNIDDAQKLQHIIKSFKLLQNYPNPFNPSTTIEYQIPRSGKVEISIFNMNGRLVKKIVNQNQNEGSYKVVWNGKNQTGGKVASGLYLYTVKFENSISSKKMLLLK